METSNIKLTQTVQKGGCAAKVAATELRKILSDLRFPELDPNVMVDGALFDDAAIYKVSEELALVQTLDFFTPILDSPKNFGKVAAANALSDVYAMGGVPKTAMAILAFPLATLDPAIATEVLQGACDVLSEAKVNLVGGHSIDDDTIKFGLSVTGYVHPKHVWSNGKAQAGDVLILTKGLGTGTVTAALKRGEITEAQMSDALNSMTQLNDVVSILPTELRNKVNSATDITGFGLLGHVLNMAKSSQKEFKIYHDQLPILELAKECLEKKFLTKAHRTNREYSLDFVKWQKEMTEVEQQIYFDPQTSGGLLLSVPNENADEIVKLLKPVFTKTSIIGEVLKDANDQRISVC